MQLRQSISLPAWWNKSYLVFGKWSDYGEELNVVLCAVEPHVAMSTTSSCTRMSVLVKWSVFKGLPRPGVSFIVIVM